MWQAQNVTPLPPPSPQDAMCLRLRNCVQHVFFCKGKGLWMHLKFRLQVCRSLSPFPQKWLLYGVGKQDQSQVLLFEDFYIRTDNTVLQLQLAPANDTWVGFAIIKYQIACKGI